MAIVRAGAGGIGGGQDGRYGVHKTEALQFGAFEFGEGVVDELAEAVFSSEVAAAGSVGGDAEGDTAIAVFKQPLVNVGFDAREGVVHGRGVRGDDHEFAGGVQDLRGWRQCAGVQHAQRRQFGKERDLEGAAAQEFGGFFIGFAASGEDEGLDAEEVALDEQDFFFVPVALAAQAGDGGVIGLAVGVVPQPQGGGEGSGAFAVVVKGDFGFATESGRGRDGVGAALPQGVEVVEPERPVAAVRSGDVLQIVLELLPQGAVFGLCGGVIGRFAVFAFFGVDAVRIERAQRVAIVQLVAGFIFGVVAEVDLLEQGQQAGAVVVRRFVLRTCS